MSDFRHTKRVVRPRRFVYDQRGLIAVSKTDVLVERTGEVTPRGMLPQVVMTEPASIVVVENAAMMVKQLDRLFAPIPSWQFKMSPVIRRKFGKSHRRSRPTEVHETVVGFFGFRSVRKDQPNRYHMPLDPMSFVSAGIRGLVLSEEEPDELLALMRWGVDLREWCHSQRLKVTPRNGGMAAALLKDPRFYLEPRRKVPRATNDRAREHLPGNHYLLNVPERQESYSAYYLDMTSAHHSAAARLQFPDANSLYARGRFRDPDSPEWDKRQAWAPQGSKKFKAVIRTHGLFLLRLDVPYKVFTKDQFPPPFLRNAGRKSAYVYSNELDLLREFGVEILGIDAAWTSAHLDTGLNKYAEFARAEAARMSEQRKRWGKPTLLATYGMLAARPNHIEFGFRNGNGEEGVYFTPAGPVAVKIRRTTREVESGIANVIHRGMIEAEIRKEVILYARELARRGIKVLSLYADSIIIDSHGKIPFLDEPWRIKDSLTHLFFYNPVTFESKEMTRTPGVPEEMRDRLTQKVVWRAIGERERDRVKLSPADAVTHLLCPAPGPGRSKRKGHRGQRARIHLDHRLERRRRVT